MQVNVYMVKDHRFEVNSWWASSPAFVVDSLNRQLDAAKAIWPELNSYRIGASATADRARRGSLGGVARAAAIPPEQRKAIASKAAKARWSKQPA